MKWMQRALVALLLALFALQVLLTSRQTSPAYDETAILPAGYVFLKTGQRHVLPQQPPVISALSALPLLAFNPRLDLNDLTLRQARPNPWNVGLNFLALNNDDDRLFLWGRLPVLLLALLLGYFTYRWARELYGDGPGLMALLLYAFCPTPAWLVFSPCPFIGCGGSSAKGRGTTSSGRACCWGPRLRARGAPSSCRRRSPR